METNKLSIKNWAEEDRPREKMRTKGISSLSNAELIAILIGSGNREESAVDVAKRVMQIAHNNLNELGKKNLQDFIKTKGIGEAKAITIMAALELGRRRSMSDILERKFIQCSKDAYNVLHPMLSDLPHEEFWVIYLNRKNKIISQEKISHGGIAGTVFDSKIIAKQAISLLASTIILSHNHPSGDPKPSNEDINITRKMLQIGKIIEITVVDHVIIGNNSYYSFADEGMLN
jgi:DNA repair protein RadC